MSKAYKPTPEQLALAEQRRLKRQLAAQQLEASNSKSSANAALLHDPRGAILPREWVKVHEESVEADARRETIRVMSWNLLAQCLVRRELFPTSDCLKAAQREHMLYREILTMDADICCLQEVDRTEKLLPVLAAAGYAHVYAAGPRKNHGCLIAFRTSAFALAGEQKVVYDDECVGARASACANSDGRADVDTSADANADASTSSDRRRVGNTRVTKNIANVVALRRVDGNGGVVVATTHLFWHPSYTYERARQVGILFREVDAFRTEIGHPDWPCIVAGDFNFQPNDAAYALLTGDALTPAHYTALAASRVIHVSRDPSIALTTPTTLAQEAEGEDEEGGGGTVKPITNARAARPEDGLLDDAELGALFARVRPPLSAYDRGLRDSTLQELTFGSREPVPEGRHGAHEPIWTSYTHYWKTVLDYIFVLDTPSAPVSVIALAKPHSAEHFSTGLPQRGVCGSDHISLGAELAWSAVSDRAEQQ